jgi:phosphoglycolate phosphatase
LEKLAKAGFSMAVVTNKPEAPARTICDALGVSRFVACVVGGDSCPVLKPDPQPVHLALESVHAGVPGSWFVGDNYTDLRAGRAAGLHTCLCRYGYGDPQGEPADVQVASFGEFVAHVLRRAEA